MFSYLFLDVKQMIFSFGTLINYFKLFALFLTSLPLEHLIF